MELNENVSCGFPNFKRERPPRALNCKGKGLNVQDLFLLL